MSEMNPLQGVKHSAAGGLKTQALTTAAASPHRYPLSSRGGDAERPTPLYRSNSGPNLTWGISPRSHCSVVFQRRWQLASSRRQTWCSIAQ